MPVINDIPPAGVPGACGWTLDTGCVPEWAAAQPADQERATTWAVFILDALTGHQFGQCPVTVRPCGPTCGMYTGYQTFPAAGPAGGAPGAWMVPYISRGLWRNCTCGGGCSCAPACRIDLGMPVAEVTEVKVDGLVLDPTAYQLVGSWLARTDGGECWPACQDPAVSDTEDGTFAVTFRPGRLLPAAGAIAAGKLAGEFLAACAGAECALPQQIVNLSRQGSEVQLVDPATVLTAGRTGIHEVDLFIEAVNPLGLRQRPRVMSPDVARHPVVYG